jgi:hypothetical protein
LTKKKRLDVTLFSSIGAAGQVLVRASTFELLEKDVNSLARMTPTCMHERVPMMRCDEPNEDR